MTLCMDIESKRMRGWGGGPWRNRRHCGKIQKLRFSHNVTSLCFT